MSLDVCGGVDATARAIAWHCDMRCLLHVALTSVPLQCPNRCVFANFDVLPTAFFVQNCSGKSNVRLAAAAACNRT